MRLSTVLIFAAVCLCSGCTETVVPSQVTSGEASWDGGVQNSGIIRDLGVGNGYLVTQRFIDRYTLRLDKYGKEEFPDLKITASDGVTKIGDDDYIVLEDVMFRATILSRRANQELGKKSE